MDDRPRLSARLVGGLTVVFTAGLMAVRVGWVEPWLRAPERRLYGRPITDLQPEGIAALPFAAFLALALAVLIALGWANRGRWRAVLRPNRGRVIGALVLGFLTPLGIFEWLPMIVGGTSLVLGGALLSEGKLDDGLVAFLWLAFALPWYPAACLIVSGIHGRLVRVAVFALMFWAAYSAIILAVGAGPRFML